MALAGTAPALEPDIVTRVREAQRSRQRLWTLKFALTWALIIGALAFVIYATENAELAWLAEWGPYIIGGVWVTILICVSSIIIATILALLGAIGRLSPNPYINGVASLYVSLVRGTPLIVQIYFVFFALPQVGIIIDAVPAGIAALAFNYGAYMTEIFRAGIQAVPRGQREAAEALWMRERIVMRRIVLPQATRIVVPAIGNEFIAMIKDSALVSIIGVQELLWRANTTGRRDLEQVQAFLFAAVVYWMLTIVFSFFQGKLERRLAESDRRL
jgi:polar amino acid transport system permease protein